MEDKALEHESIRRLTANYEASRAIAERNREAEDAECEWRPSSENAAKHVKQLEVQRLSAETADLNARMLQQTTLNEAAAQRRNESKLLIARMTSEFEARRTETAQPLRTSVPPEHLDDYVRQTVTLQRSQQVVDQLTAMLERTQRTLAAEVTSKATAVPFSEDALATRPPAPPLPSTAAASVTPPQKAWVYDPVSPRCYYYSITASTL